jgi:hypothetical protein
MNWLNRAKPGNPLKSGSVRNEVEEQTVNCDKSN